MVPVNIDRVSADTVQCIFTPRTVGPHSLFVSYGGFPLPGSPYQASVENSGSGVRVVLTGKGLAAATCGQPADFTVDGSQAGPGTCTNRTSSNPSIYNRRFKGEFFNRRRTKSYLDWDQIRYRSNAAEYGQ